MCLLRALISVQWDVTGQYSPSLIVQWLACHKRRRRFCLCFINVSSFLSWYPLWWWWKEDWFAAWSALIPSAWIGVLKATLSEEVCDTFSFGLMLWKHIILGRSFILFWIIILVSCVISTDLSLSDSDISEVLRPTQQKTEGWVTKAKFKMIPKDKGHKRLFLAIIELFLSWNVNTIIDYITRGTTMLKFSRLTPVWCKKTMVGLHCPCHRGGQCHVFEQKCSKMLRKVFDV